MRRGCVGDLSVCLDGDAGRGARGPQDFRVEFRAKFHFLPTPVIFRRFPSLDAPGRCVCVGDMSVFLDDDVGEVSGRPEKTYSSAD